MATSDDPDTVRSMAASSTTAADPPVDRPIAALDSLRFDNRWVAALPADPATENRRRQVHGAAFSRVSPTPVAAPRTLLWSPEVLDLLGLDPALPTTDDFAQVFAGNRLPAGAEPFAANYGGHQFGNWAGQLGDGRAIALGEVVDAAGRRQVLQLKGAGPTPYSRTADGRAVLRSSLREMLCSEAMHHLGVATTRALCLVATGEDVVRDVLYDGHPAPEPGAVVCRVAPSFTRFGTFQLPASRGEVDLLRRLVDHTIAEEAPHLLASGDLSPTERVVAWFDQVVDRSVDLVVDWMRVGFVHGVLNTDNLSTLGLTIDYGPYGWLESFDPAWTPNTTDAGTRRYRYGAQPQVVHWNLMQLANALVPLTEVVDGLQSTLDGYATRYEDRFAAMMAERLGWGAPADDDAERIAGLYTAMTLTEIDQVIFFRELARVPVGEEADDATLLAPLAEAFYDPAGPEGPARPDLLVALRSWAERVRRGGLDEADRVRRMDAVNPRFVLRNYLAQEAIDAATAGDLAPAWELLDVVRRPYDEQPGRERFAARRPEWARHRVGSSMLSCSS